MHFYSGVDIEVQDGVLLSLPFADSCVLANRIRSLTSQGGGTAVWGRRSMFLLFAGRDVLVAEGDGGREREKEVWDNDTNEGVMFISSLSSSFLFILFMPRNIIVCLCRHQE